MRTRSLLILGAMLMMIVASPITAGGKKQQVLANRHLTAIVFMQQWIQAIYRLGGSADPGCPFPPPPFVDNGDGTFTQTIQCTDGTLIVNTVIQAPSDYNHDVTYPNGLTEMTRARTTALFNGGPGTVHFNTQLSNGTTVDYDQELQQDPAVNGGGDPILGLNFLYGLLSTGTVDLPDGRSVEFELRQTQAFSCFNFFNGEDIPPDVCAEWFDFNVALNRWVPKPDRLHMQMDNGNTLDLEFPLLAPGGVLDFSKPVTGTLMIGRRKMTIKLSTDDPATPAWKFWETSGRGYRGGFLLNPDFSGGGQVFRVRRGGAKKKRRPVLQFATRWNSAGIATVILRSGQTRPGSPTAGALDFASSRWSGLSSAFGPSPGL